MEEQGEWEVHFRRVAVKMSDGSVFMGRVNIRTFQRLSDFFRSADDRFIVLLAEEEQPQKVLMLNKNYIVWAEASD